MVDGDVPQTRVENGGMQQNEAHVPAGNGGDACGVHVGAVGQVIGGADDIVDAHADECAANESGTETEQIESPRMGAFMSSVPGGEGRGGDSQDDVAGSCQGVEAGFVCTGDRIVDVDGVRHEQQNGGVAACAGRDGKLALDVDSFLGWKNEGYRTWPPTIQRVPWMRRAAQPIP